MTYNAESIYIYIFSKISLPQIIFIEIQQLSDILLYNMLCVRQAKFDLGKNLKFGIGL